MKLNALVLSEETRKGNNAKGAWEMTTLTLMDMGDKPRCKTPIEVTLGEDDEDLKGMLEGETIVVDILSLESGYKGSIRARGNIIRGSVETPATPAQAARSGHPGA